jgi:uncharacterized membrane protein
MQKVNYRKALAALLFIFLMIFFSGMFVGCGSSKKHKEKESYENTVKKEIDSSSSSSVKTDDKVKEENKVSEELSEEVLDVEVKDGEELEISNYDSQGNKTGSTKYSGSGKAKKSKSNKKTESNFKKEAESKTESKGKKDFSGRSHAEQSGDKLIVDKQQKGSSFCTYLFWIILLIVVAIALWYLNKRFKWFFWLSNLFTKFFGM